MTKRTVFAAAAAIFAAGTFATAAHADGVECTGVIRARARAPARWARRPARARTPARVKAGPRPPTLSAAPSRAARSCSSHRHRSRQRKGRRDDSRRPILLVRSIPTTWSGRERRRTSAQPPNRQPRRRACRPRSAGPAHCRARRHTSAQPPNRRRARRACRPRSAGRCIAGNADVFLLSHRVRRPRRRACRPRSSAVSARRAPPPAVSGRSRGDRKRGAEQCGRRER